MKIDGRKAYMRIRISNGKEIYVTKLASHIYGRMKYAVGINGTSLHYSNLSKSEAEQKIDYLISKSEV